MQSFDPLSLQIAKRFFQKNSKYKRTTESKSEKGDILLKQLENNNEYVVSLPLNACQIIVIIIITMIYWQIQ